MAGAGDTDDRSDLASLYRPTRKSVGEVYRISISDTKGSKKYNVGSVSLKQDSGIIGDAHAGSGRQVSLLPFEAFDLIRKNMPEIKPGDFAENITTRGIDLSSVSVGDHILIGENAQLIITHIGKICHNDCAIKQAVGDCIMPRLGVFASVARGGSIRVGERISLQRDHD